MKIIKTLPFLAGAIFFLAVTLTGYAAEKVTIKDVEYLKGTDFVQLRFVTDRIISIPDVFYPEENNPGRLMMRIGDVEFNVTKDSLHFDSPVIDSIVFHKQNNFTDVEINLKARVNYRVFTNRNGLYIEFPNPANAKIQSLPLPTKPAPTTAKNNGAAALKETNSNGLIAKEANVARPTVKETYNPGFSSKESAANGRISIKNINITEKNADKIRIEFEMSSGRLDYNVIPILESPVRLAIDLMNTQGLKINKPIDHLNVKTLRGDRNSSTVFRVVFDLHYLKSYSVALNKNVLEVEFYNVESTARKKSGAPLQSTGMNSPAGDSREMSAPGVNAAAEQSPALQSPGAMSPGLNDKAPLNKSKNLNPGNDRQPQQDDAIIMNPAQEVDLKDALTIPAEKKNEFFSEEKSLVSQENVQPPPQTQKQIAGGAIAEFESKTIDEGKIQWTGELRSYHLKNQDLVNLLIHFARDTGLNMVFDPDISGSVTAELNDVPWDQALDIFLRQNGLAKQSEGNVVRIASITKLASEAQQRKQLQDSLQQEARLKVDTRVLNYTKAGDVKKILDKSLSVRGSIIIDERSNTLVIHDVPENFPVLDGLIKELDKSNPQVSIEAKMIETNSNYAKNLGIQWGYNFIADSAFGNQTSLKFPNSIGVFGNQYTSQTSPLVGPLGGYAVNLPAPGASAGTVFSLGNIANTFRLDMALSAMQRNGKGRIIQAPRFVTQNNVQSRITQGYKIPVQILQNNTITVIYKDVTLQLVVKPTITADDTITMDIDIKNDNVDWGNYVDKFPAIMTQSAKTTVKARNGETVVIGGMYKVESGTTKNTVPLLFKIPILGNLFKSTVRSSQQRETIIFITPRIVK